jgi:hypothetical protein
MSDCRSCHAPILWAMTASGKRMPMDPDPVATGTFALTLDDPPTAIHAPATVPAGTVRLGADGFPARFTSHFATCPNASQHRRKK